MADWCPGRATKPPPPIGIESPPKRAPAVPAFAAPFAGGYFYCHQIFPQQANASKFRYGRQLQTEVAHPTVAPAILQTAHRTWLQSFAVITVSVSSYVTLLIMVPSRLIVARGLLLGLVGVALFAARCASSCKIRAGAARSVQLRFELPMEQFVIVAISCVNSLERRAARNGLVTGRKLLNRAFQVHTIDRSDSRRSVPPKSSRAAPSSGSVCPQAKSRPGSSCVNASGRH